MTLGINSSCQQQRGKENYTIGVCNHRWSVLRLRRTKQHPLRRGNNFILCDMIFRFLKFMLVWICKIMNQIFYDLSTTWYAIFTFFCASFPISLCYLRICQFSLTTLKAIRATRQETWVLVMPTKTTWRLAGMLKLFGKL